MFDKKSLPILKGSINTEMKWIMNYSIFLVSLWTFKWWSVVSKGCIETIFQWFVKENVKRMQIWYKDA